MDCSVAMKSLQATGLNSIIFTSYVLSFMPGWVGIGYLNHYIFTVTIMCVMVFSRNMY